MSGHVVFASLAKGRFPPDSEIPEVRYGRVALAARNAQGVRLGNPRNLAEAGAKGAVTQRAEADAFAANVLSIVRQIEAAGAKTHRAVADSSNGNGLGTVGVHDAEFVGASLRHLKV